MPELTGFNLRHTATEMMLADVASRLQQTPAQESLQASSMTDGPYSSNTLLPQVGEVGQKMSEQQGKFRRKGRDPRALESRLPLAATTVPSPAATAGQEKQGEAASKQADSSTQIAIITRIRLESHPQRLQPPKRAGNHPPRPPTATPLRQEAESEAPPAHDHRPAETPPPLAATAGRRRERRRVTAREERRRTTTPEALPAATPQHACATMAR